VKTLRRFPGFHCVFSARRQLEGRSKERQLASHQSPPNTAMPELRWCQQEAVEAVYCHLETKRANPCIFLPRARGSRGSSRALHSLQTQCAIYYLLSI